MAYDIDKPVELTADQKKLYADLLDRGYTVLATEKHGQIKITVIKPSRAKKHFRFAGSPQNAQERDRT